MIFCLVESLRTLGTSTCQLEIYSERREKRQDQRSGLLMHLKYSFPMNPHVRLLAGLSVG